MAHPKMKAITMPFKEVKVDEEGNTVYRRVRHNALYLPNYKAEKPTR